MRSFAGHPGYLRRAFGPGWALVGDAGYWKDPISAHGLTDAFRDAELLARAVVSSWSGDAGPQAAFAGYQATRDRLAAPLFAAVDVIGAYDWDDSQIGSHLLRASSAMADEVDALAALEPAGVA